MMRMEVQFKVNKLKNDLPLNTPDYDTFTLLVKRVILITLLLVYDKVPCLNN